MLVSNLFLTMALGTVVSARAVEKSDRLGSFQRPITNPLSPHPIPSFSPHSCIFTPSLPMPPASFVSTLPSSLHHHLPNILLSHSSFASNPPSSLGSKAPRISTLSLSEETGDSSLQGVFLGLVYTSTSTSSTTSSPKSSPKPKPSSRCKSTRPNPSSSSNPPPNPQDQPPTHDPTSEAHPRNQSQDPSNIDKSWDSSSESHPNPHELRASPPSSPNMEMRRCFTEAVGGVRDSRLVEGMLEFPGEGGRLRFLVWRVD